MVTRTAPNPHAPASWGGREQQIYNLCAFLLESGQTVDLYSANVVQATGRLPFRVRMAPLLTARRATGNYDSTIRNLLFSFYVAAIANRYDLVHTHDGLATFGLASVLGTTGTRSPLVVTFHMVGLAWLLHHPEKALGHFVRNYSTLYPAEKTTARSADRVIAPSKSIAADLTRLYNVPPSKITVIPNGVDPSQFALIDKKTCKKALGVNDDTRVILFLGRLDEPKGISVLLDAFETLQQSNVELHIAGGGPLAGMVQARALSQPRIHYHGFVGPASQTKRVLACAADVFVNPSFYEGLPYSVLEMMAWQRPLVLSDIPSHRELASGLAQYFEPGKSTSLAQALDRVLGDDLDPPREDCLVRIKEEYSMEVQNQLTMQVYQRALHG